MAETQKQKLIRILGCTDEEADDIIKTDKIIDQGGRTPYDLSKEKEKEAKKMANVKTKTIYKLDARGKTKKENPIKGNFIALLANFLEKNDEIGCENVKITNKERQIAFSIGENDFELTLVQKRKKK